MLQHGVPRRAWSENDEDDEDNPDDSSEGSGHDDESDYPNERIDAPASRRRIEICEQCNEYNVLHNDKRSCKWHEGKLHYPYQNITYRERC